MHYKWHHQHVFFICVCRWPLFSLKSVISRERISYLSCKSISGLLHSSSLMMSFLGSMFPNEDRGGKWGCYLPQGPPRRTHVFTQTCLGVLGDLSVIDHPFSLLPSSLTWVWDTERPDTGQAAAGIQDLIQPPTMSSHEWESKASIRQHK